MGMVATALEIIAEKQNSEFFHHGNRIKNLRLPQEEIDERLRRILASLSNIQMLDMIDEINLRQNNPLFKVHDHGRG